MSLVHRIVSVERPAHLLSSGIFIRQLSVLDQELFNHLRLQLNVQAHTAISAIKINFKAWLGGFDWALKAADAGTLHRMHRCQIVSILLEPFDFHVFQTHSILQCMQILCHDLNLAVLVLQQLICIIQLILQYVWRCCRHLSAGGVLDMLRSLVAVFGLLLEEIRFLPQFLNQVVFLHNLALELLDLTLVSVCLRRLAVGRDLRGEPRASVCCFLEIAASE